MQAQSLGPRPSPLARDTRAGWGAAPVSRSAPGPGRSPTESAEREADSVASAVLEGRAVSVTPRRSAPVGGPVPRWVAGASHEGMRLPAPFQSLMSSALGGDFGDVRVHDDGPSARAAQALDARAFTVGQDVYFGAGEYDPRRSDAAGLLVHELVHTAQQRGAPPSLMLKKKRTFTPGRPAHDHQPGGVLRWLRIQADALLKCNPSTEEGRIHCVCGTHPPQGVIMASLVAEFSDKPVARDHLAHYLGGSGKTVNEDATLRDMVTKDAGVRGMLAAQIAKADRGHMFLRQTDYADQDFRYAFGGIDRLEWEVDKGAGTVDVWFKDRYDFHPVGFGYTNKGTGDFRRKTNCVHAAAVELKPGAADYWMQGLATFPLKTFTSAPKKKRKKGGTK